MIYLHNSNIYVQHTVRQFNGHRYQSICITVIFRFARYTSDWLRWLQCVFTTSTLFNFTEKNDIDDAYHIDVWNMLAGWSTQKSNAITLYLQSHVERIGRVQCVSIRAIL